MPRPLRTLLTDLWCRMSHDDVFQRIATSFLEPGLQFGAGALLGRGRGATALLDTEPLRRTAVAELDTDTLSANIASGHPGAVGVVATRVPAAAPDTVAGTASGRSVLFLQEQSPSGWPGDPDRAVDVVRCRIGVDHVLASAAIPVAFPAQRITEPARAAGWYVDGGVRLNTPLRPAIELGATRLIVISATSTDYAAELPPDPSDDPPDLADSAAQVMHAVLADRMVEDLHRLKRRNAMVRESAQAERGGGGAGGYRLVEHLAVSPRPGAMGRLADEVFREKVSGLHGLKEPDLNLIGKLLRGAGDATGRRELLSYLLFDEEYFRRSIDHGRQAAKRALSLGWQT